MAMTMDESPSILIIDDELSVLLVMEAMLAVNGYDPITCTNGLEAVRTYLNRKQDIAAILVDLGMPGMDGCDVIREVRKIDLEVPIIIMTGYLRHQGLRETSNLSVNAILTKPFLPEDVLSVLKAVVESKGSLAHN